VVLVRSEDGAAPWLVRPLRIGVVNIMPRAETYEPYLVRPLARAALPVELTWIRLESHTYASSDAERIDRHYVTYAQATSRLPLDGLLLTGAPVEEMNFESVRYWVELCAILTDCRAKVASVLGLCWGGLALARQLGIDKDRFDTKLFGVYRETTLDPEHPVLGGSDDVFHCTHSRHAGIRPERLEEARDAGVVRLLSHGLETGHSIFESADRRFLSHLGHPEYEAARLVHEWERDSSLGRVDVAPPANFDPAKPANVWRSHCNELFGRWLQDVSARGKETRAAGSAGAPADEPFRAGP
jgi:homoserine O-succinyltransferase/O-acetyltransferase